MDAAKLIKITIPKSVTYIGNGAFQHTTNLVDIYFYGSSLPSYGLYIFSSSGIKNIYVTSSYTGSLGDTTYAGYDVTISQMS